ncbi:MAG TPA: phage tail protein [Xanthobacteraceae bacterium]|nr:phage tail protein [Xanthobacteraceae bacterium]
MAEGDGLLPAYSFRATVGGQSVGFAEVTGLGIERESVTYSHGLSHWEGESLITFPSRRHRPVSLKRGVLAGDGGFYDWLVKAEGEPRPMDVSLCDASGAPRVTWRIKQAVPTKLTAPAFDARANEVAIDTLEVMVSGVSVEQGG